MSKSRGNVVNPDDVVGQFGADSLRLYEMFMGPLRDTKVRGEARRAPGPRRAAPLARRRPGLWWFHAEKGTPWTRAADVPRRAAPPPQVWNTRGVEGVHRFLARVYRALEGGVRAAAVALNHVGWLGWRVAWCVRLAATRPHAR
jgi:hypothetical protein